MKCRLKEDMKAGPSASDSSCVIDESGVRIVKAGSEIDHPQSAILSHGGHAECLDDECREAVAKMDPKTSQTLKKVHDKIRHEREEFIDELEERQEQQKELDELDEE